MSVLETVSQQIEQLFQSAVTSASSGSWEPVFTSLTQAAQSIQDNRDELMQEVALLVNINLDMDFVTYEVLGINTPLTSFIGSTLNGMYLDSTVPAEQQPTQAQIAFANEWQYYYAEFFSQVADTLTYLVTSSADVLG